MEWSDVPAKVCANLVQVVPVAHKIAEVVRLQAPAISAVWYQPETKLAAAVYHDPLAVLSLHTIDDIVGVVPASEMTGENWVLCKTADSAWLSAPAKAWGSAQKLLGGPSPMAAMLTGGLVGSGLGYGGMSLMGLPASSRVRKRMARTGLAIGGLAGAGLGAGWGISQYMADPNNGNQTLKDRGAGWFSSWPFQKEGALQDWTTPSIPVDAFNQMVWNDVSVRKNPFGSKSQWGDNSQSLGTPPAVAAAATGLVAGASAIRGGADTVSPIDIALAAAAGGTKGLIGGMVLGKTLSALANLSPETQTTLQRAGFWGGAITAAVQKALGY